MELEALQELFQSTDRCGKVDQYVIRRYRDTEANLRTTFGKICDRAGVSRFAKPFMNCRTTRRNELDRQGVRNAALNAWFGHSKETAERHYDRVTEDDFADALVAVGQSLGEQEAPTPIKNDENPTKNPPLTLAKGVGGGFLYTPEDSG